MLLQGLLATALLGPSAIGLYGVVTTTAMTIVALRRVGIDEAFVQQAAEDEEAEFQRAFGVELAVGLVASLAIALLAPVLAAVYGDDRLLALTLGVAYLPVAFSLQAPQWIFFRRMDFLRLRLLQAIVPLGTVLVSGAAAARRRRRVGARDRAVLRARGRGGRGRARSRPTGCGRASSARRRAATCASRGPCSPPRWRRWRSRRARSRCSGSPRTGWRRRAGSRSRRRSRATPTARTRSSRRRSTRRSCACATASRCSRSCSRSPTG